MEAVKDSLAVHDGLATIFESQNFKADCVSAGQKIWLPNQTISPAVMIPFPATQCLRPAKPFSNARQSLKVNARQAQGRISLRSSKVRVPDEFLQRLDLEAAADVQKGKTLSIKDKGWWNFVCHFVFDPFSFIYYCWLSHIALAVLYNCIVIPARVSFSDLEDGSFFSTWVILDILADALYVLDSFASFRVGFWERGLLVSDTKQLLKKYVNTMMFYIDLFSIIPIQIAYAFTTRNVALLARFSRFFKFHRLVKWNDRTECRTKYPTLWRVITLCTIMLMIMHWNACFYFYISTNVITQDSESNPYRNKFLYPDSEKIGATNIYSSTSMKYAVSLYWSTQAMTTIGEVRRPEELWEYLYHTIILLIGVMIFASVVGSIGNIITNLRAHRNVFQARLDNLKEYMGYRKIGKDLQNRIVRWFDYLRAQNHTFEEEDVLKYLPDKLQALLAVHVHLETLKEVVLFQNCERGFLTALVTKLKRQVFSPGDYVCRKGDIGREMFIVKQGLLHVTTDNGRPLGALTSGSYFGEISLLNVGRSNNRRTANVRSVGYSDLFCLRKEDLLHVLDEYPEMKEVLKKAARKRLAHDGEPEEDEQTHEHERRATFSDIVEQTDNLEKRLEDLEQLMLMVTKEINTTHKSVSTLQKHLNKMHPGSNSSTNSDPESGFTEEVV